jgi:hypothetical protein
MAVTIDRNLFNQIETLRGREKRSTFVEHLLRLGLNHYLHSKRGFGGRERE